jgi:hypothetical protein
MRHLNLASSSSWAALKELRELAVKGEAGRDAAELHGGGGASGGGQVAGVEEEAGSASTWCGRKRAVDVMRERTCQWWAEIRWRRIHGAATLGWPVAGR